MSDRQREFFSRISAAYAERVQDEIVGNIDVDRWNGLPITARLTREKSWAAATLSLLMQASAAFEGVYGLFSDDASRDLFVDLVLYRLLGQRRVRLARNCDEHWEQRAKAQSLRGTESAFTGLFGRLHRFEVTFENERILVDCSWANIAWTFFMRQYYLDRPDSVVCPQPGDLVIDAGACYVDTALAFAASVGQEGRVHAFEIDPANLEIARHNLALNPQLATRISLHGEALGEEVAQRYLHGSGPGAQVRDQPGGTPVKMNTLDEFVGRNDVGFVDFIKMDIEGAELHALKGAVRTLSRFKPRLAISVYHRADDLLLIPLWLSEQGLGYKFYLEHYTIHHEETVLYAVAE